MSGSELKVLQIVANLEIGGAQEVVRTLVEYLAASDCVPVVCTFKDGPLRRDIEQLGIKVEVMDLPRHSIVALPLFIVDMVRIWQALAQLIRKHAIDVVQTHLLGSLDFLTFALPYATNLSVVLWTFHSISFLPSKGDVSRYRWLLKPKRYVHRLLYGLTSHKVSGFIAVSNEVRDSMIELIGPIQDKITVICNGVDVKRYERSVDKHAVRQRLGLETNTRLIATVGTLKEEKGHRYLIDAAATIVPQHPDWHFLFIGDGRLREELQARVRELGLSKNIHFLGSRRDVPDLLAASDLFVLPSLWEGLPMALVEAMAAGIPVVATAVSGTVQVMIPGETGLVVPPGNTQMLTRAIIELLSDPIRAQAMGVAATQRVQAEFSAEKQANEYLALYRRLLGTPSVFVPATI
jgi:glycosyltransferase involved in cell wall biosynthesis